jgi:hypothetical protein
MGAKLAHPFEEEKNYGIILKSRELPSKHRRLLLKKRTGNTKVKNSKLSHITLLFS